MSKRKLSAGMRCSLWAMSRIARYFPLLDDADRRFLIDRLQSDMGDAQEIPERFLSDPVTATASTTGHEERTPDYDWSDPCPPGNLCPGCSAAAVAEDLARLRACPIGGCVNGPDPHAPSPSCTNNMQASPTPSSAAADAGKDGR